MRYACVQSGEPSGRRVHLGSGGFTRASLEVVGFVLVRVGSLGRASRVLWGSG